MKKTTINKFINNWLYAGVGLFIAFVIITYSFAQQAPKLDMREQAIQSLKNIIAKKYSKQSKIELRGHTENPKIFRWGVNVVTFSPDGKIIASGSRGAGDNLILWDAITGKKIAVLEGYAGVVSILFSSDGSKMLSGGDTIILWDIATRTKIMTFDSSVGQINRGGVKGMTWSPDEKILVAVSNAPKRHVTQPQNLVIWDVATGRKITELEGHPNLVTSMDFSPDGKKIVSGSYARQPLGPRDDKGSLIVWDISNINDIKDTTLLIGDFAVQDVRFFNDSNMVVATDSEGRASLWNIEGGNINDISLYIGPEVRSIGAMAYNSDTKKLFLEANLWHGKTGLDNRAMFNVNLIEWDKSISNNKRIYPEFSWQRKGYCEAAVFMSHGSMIASGGDTLELLDASTGALLKTLIDDHAGIQSLAFSPDGTRLVSGAMGKNNLILWKLSDDYEQMIFEQLQKCNDDQFLLIEKLCIAESENKTIQLTQSEYVLFEKLDIVIKNLFTVGRAESSWKDWFYSFLPNRLY